MARWRCWMLLGLVAMGWGCTRPCREGTVFLRLTYDANLQADLVRVTTALGGFFLFERSFSPSPGEDSIEVRFPDGYREGAMLVVMVEATSGSGRVGGGEAREVLKPGCTVVRVQVRRDGGGDMGVPPPDMTPPPDMPPPPFTPSHLTPAAWALGTVDLTVNSSIDTTSFLIDGAPPPVGVSFVEMDGLAVLSVTSFDIAQGSTVRVTGTRPLVVVARYNLTIAGTLDGSAQREFPGPGGSPPGMGPGAGIPFGTFGTHQGGSGAGHGGIGGFAGAAFGNGCTADIRQLGGNVYGDATLMTLEGGSGGGYGGLGGTTCLETNQPIYGGAGGGASQLSAGLAVIISGVVHVSGGGGRGGCVITSNPIDNGSGGGGGSGGSLLVEALTVDLRNSTLAANGGGGGGASGTLPGEDGRDGLASITPAQGGRGEIFSQNGGRGGAGGTTRGENSRDVNGCNSGGGGGAVGRIYIRSRGNAQTTGSTISPAPTLATNL